MNDRARSRSPSTGAGSAILLAVSVVVGCGGRAVANAGATSDASSDAGATSDASTPMGREQFLDAFVTAWCAYYASCPEATLGLAPQTQCADAFFEIRRFWSWSLPHLNFDPLEAESCLDAMNQVACLRGSGMLAALQFCTYVFRGSSIEEEPCRADDDCQAEYDCDLNPMCPGYCMPLPGEGQHCNGQCAKGLECDEYETCRARIPRGAACQSEDCAFGTFCDLGPGRTNTCRPWVEFAAKRATGQRCQYDFECSASDYCSTNTQLCSPRVLAGAPCEAWGQSCMPGLYCSGNDRGIGNCVEQIPVGGRCRLNTGYLPCQQGSECFTTVCGYASRLGEPCETLDQCFSDYCVSGRCAVYPTCD